MCFFEGYTKKERNWKVGQWFLYIRERPIQKKTLTVNCCILPTRQKLFILLLNIDEIDVKEE
jgi:hypothetical protein